MKKSLLTLAVASAVALTACGPDKKAEEPKVTEQTQAAEAEVALDSNEQKVSYGLGQNIANQFQQSGLPVDAEAFYAGFSDKLADKEARLSEKEIGEAMKVIQEDLVAQQQKKREKEAAENKTKGEAFLKENASKEGVKVTESGLQYEVLAEGEGAKPSRSSRVTVHYRGTLLDGTEFDSSYSRGQPASFALSQVIPGWTEGLQLMSPGAKYKLYIPSDLAYGPGGAGGRIGPNSTLIFEVELISVDGEVAPREPTAEELEAAEAIKAYEEAEAAKAAEAEGAEAEGAEAEAEPAAE